MNLPYSIRTVSIKKKIHLAVFFAYISGTTLATKKFTEFSDEKHKFQNQLDVFGVFLLLTVRME